MIDATKTRGLMLLALLSVPSSAMAQRPAGDSITYRAQNGVLDATGQESTDAGLHSQEQNSSDGNTRGEAGGPATGASTADPGLYGRTPFPGAAKADADNPATAKPSSTRPLVTVTSSLAIVLGLFAGLVWLTRRSGGKATGQLPEDVFALLGRTTLGPRQNITLARCGRRILVLAVSPSSTSTLAEITDPDEVADIAAQCGNGGSRHLFQRTLKEMGEQEPATPGFIDAAGERPSRGLFASG